MLFFYITHGYENKKDIETYVHLIFNRFILETLKYSFSILKKEFYVPKRHYLIHVKNCDMINLIFISPKERNKFVLY